MYSKTPVFVTNDEKAEVVKKRLQKRSVSCIIFKEARGRQIADADASDTLPWNYAEAV